MKRYKIAKYTPLDNSGSYGIVLDGETYTTEEEAIEVLLIMKENLNAREYLTIFIDY